MAFKAIIVGGGPVGLTTALTLKAANIDYVLLEQYNSVVPKNGADLVIMPMVMRVLSQLGLLDDFLRISFPLSLIQRIDHDKNDLGALPFFQSIEEKFVCPPSSLSLTVLFYYFVILIRIS